MIAHSLAAALRSALETGGLPEPARGVSVIPTKRREHGDFQSGVAMELAKPVGAPPLEIAARIIAALEPMALAHVERIEVAKPGFINFFLAPTWLHEVLRDVVHADDQYGHGHAYDDKRLNLEFVSANPTGPLHAGGGRWVAVGDAIANLLSAQGAEVHREYYLNDAGNQLDTFTASLMARYRGEAPPDDGYQGEYLVGMAEQMRTELGNDVTDDAAREWGIAHVVAMLRDDLARIGVHFDTWFSERSLHERGDVETVLGLLRERGHVYERDGAEWLRSEALGDQGDRVLIRSDGRTTYLCNDLAYHRDKWSRKFDHLIDIWGADHHAQVKSLQVGMRALGIGTEDTPEPEVILGQFVDLQRGGEKVRLGKRAGNIITLADILDEVDPDVARLTFLLQSIDTTQTFDLEVVTAHSMQNPVYYVQYAHARIASIGRVAAARGVAREPLDDVDLGVLTHERELDLLRALAEYPGLVATAAELRAPHRVTTWVRDFAGRFHGFYRDCRVISDDVVLTQARLWLAESCRIGLADALAILGVHAPEVMERLDTDEEGDANDELV